MPRPIWKGFITFGLVNIPIILYPAEKKTDIQFHLVDARDKSRVRYIRINEQSGEEVPWENIAKGYEFNDHDYVLIKDEDLKTIAGTNPKAIDIESFIDKNSLDFMDFDKPYYIVPDKKGEKGYVILREILKSTGKIGIAKVFIHTREYLAALIPHEDALILNLLRYHHELRDISEFDLPSKNLNKYKITAKELTVAKQLVTSMATEWNPNEYKDEYRIALQNWIDEQTHHKKTHKTKKSKSPKTTNVIDFVSLLKKSLKDKKSNRRKKSQNK